MFVFQLMFVFIHEYWILSFSVLGVIFYAVKYGVWIFKFIVFS